MAQPVPAAAPASTMKRPGRHDPAIVAVAVRELAAECAEWKAAYPAESWIEPLTRAIRDWDDGYRLARALEGFVRPDADLVEILAGASSTLSSAHEDAVRKWVEIVGFAPAHAVGDVVRYRHGEGPVNEVRTRMAQYIVDVEGRGPGKGGHVVNAEDIEP